MIVYFKDLFEQGTPCTKRLSLRQARSTLRRQGFAQWEFFCEEAVRHMLNMEYVSIPMTIGASPNVERSSAIESVATEGIAVGVVA
jgi:hypothetical protein